MPGPLERTYYADVGYPLDNVSIANMHKSAWWAFKASLMKQGPFAANSGAVTAWTCIGSSDGVTAGCDAVDRWGSTYDVSKIIIGANTSATRSWFVVGNTTLGVWFIIDLSNSSDPTRCGFFLCTAAPTGGSTTARPTSSAEISIGTSNMPTYSTAGGKAHRCFDSEGYFTFLTSRNGTAINLCWSLAKVTDTRLSDGKPWVFLIDTGTAAADNTNACRGDSTSGTVNAAGWKGTIARSRAVSPLDGTTAMTIIPGFLAGNAANAFFAGHMSGADAADASFPDFPLHALGVSGLVSVKGRLYDWRQTSGPPTGAAFPASGSNMTHLCVGNCWIPWTTPISL